MNDRIAVIDVGTNTALLLVTDLEDGRLRPVRDERRFVRLGEGVDGSRRISERALGRLEGVLAEFAGIARSEGAGLVSIAGTSASRDATNRGRLERAALEHGGVEYDVLDGHTEAALSFAGTMAALEDIGAEATVLDVGGGSTEMVRGTTGPPITILASGSANVGSVRLTERFFSSLPPSAAEVERGTSWAVDELSPVGRTVGSTNVLVGAAGTAVVLAGLHHGTREDATAWPAIDKTSVIAWRDRLLRLDAESVLALDPELLFGRADVFAAGVLIVERAMSAVGAERLVVSPWGLRHGLALRASGQVRVG